MADVSPIPKASKPKRPPRSGPSLSASAAYVCARAAGRCEHPDGCTARPQCIHHRKGRVGADAHASHLLLALCTPCHLKTHANPDDSYANGALLHRHGIAPDPLEGTL